MQLLTAYRYTDKLTENAAETPPASRVRKRIKHTANLSLHFALKNTPYEALRISDEREKTAILPTDSLPLLYQIWGCKPALPSKTSGVTHNSLSSSLPLLCLPA